MGPQLTKMGALEIEVISYMPLKCFQHKFRFIQIDSRFGLGLSLTLDPCLGHLSYRIGAGVEPHISTRKHLNDPA